ncbi:hypothetical protein [Thetidibacter halocola]|uniref:Uncharacterized protein n=1 Tax=Thetidibacter halocola TaxID=2827239 RepID=A0A8J7WC92_9RHOB|nr:hypothetical protein [Thetidibacter halocola]MBS0122738.1 hypothetical protein [Thetidibacter halocola]
MGSIRKQTQNDFQQRLRRVDPAFQRHGGPLADATPRRPFLSLLAGFGGAYLVVMVASNKPVLESSLRQGALPGHLHDTVMMGLSALLAISFVMLGVHLFRFLVGRRGSKKSNSAALLTGVVGALALVYTPTSVWQTGLGMMDDNSRAIVLAASSSFSEVMPELDFGTVTLASSFGK